MAEEMTVVTVGIVSSMILSAMSERVSNKTLYSDDSHMAREALKK